jgi:hypothetical protein
MVRLPWVSLWADKVQFSLQMAGLLRITQVLHPPCDSGKQWVLARIAGVRFRKLLFGFGRVRFIELFRIRKQMIRSETDSAD